MNGLVEAQTYRIIWISGPPGCGKTTLVNSLRAARVAAGDDVVSYFFAEPSLDEVHHVWPSVAYQLARRSYRVRQELASAAAKGSCPRAIKDQFKDLIAKPIDARSAQRRLVVVIDGLDRAAASQDVEDYMHLLETIQSWPKRIDRHCVLIFSSRVVHDIKKYLDHVGPPLHVIDPRSLQSSSDIELFLTEKLNTLRKH